MSCKFKITYIHKYEHLLLFIYCFSFDSMGKVSKR